MTKAIIKEYEGLLQVDLHSNNNLVFFAVCDKVDISEGEGYYVLTLFKDNYITGFLYPQSYEYKEATK